MSTEAKGRVWRIRSMARGPDVVVGPATDWVTVIPAVLTNSLVEKVADVLEERTEGDDDWSDLARAALLSAGFVPEQEGGGDA